MDTQKKASWLERVEEIISVLDGSTIGELELTEDGTEIIIRRTPGVIMNTSPSLPAGAGTVERQVSVPSRKPVDQSQPIVSPITGVYYAAASPTSPPFVNIGDVIHAGQVVALVEAMKIFNEITAEISGRVVKISAPSGEVVQKGDVLIRVEPL